MPWTMHLGDDGLQNKVFFEEEASAFEPEIFLRASLETSLLCTIQSLPNSLLYGQDSAETVRSPQAEAPFQHCSAV